MTKYVHSVTRYPLSVLCIALIWVLSLAPYFPETPLSHVNLIDKYTHFIMYGGTTAVIWWEHLRHCRKEARRLDRRAMLCVLVAMVALGGLIELLQAYCTSTRSGEWLDFWADSIGVVIGTVIGLALQRWFRVPPAQS